MLVIRQAQLEALGRARRRTFENRAIDQCKARGTRVGADGSEDAIRQFVQQAIQRALGYGLCHENYILRFIDMLPGLGASAEAAACEPWAIEILTDAALSPAVKITLLEHGVRGGEQGAGAP